MKKLIVLLFLISASTLFISCSSYNSADKKRNVASTTKQSDERIVNYDNGVYYFYYTEARFANALSSFMGEHQDLELVSMTSDNTAGYGASRGYFVVFKKRAVPEK